MSWPLLAHPHLLLTDRMHNSGQLLTVSYTSTEADGKSPNLGASPKSYIQRKSDRSKRQNFQRMLLVYIAYWSNRIACDCTVSLSRIFHLSISFVLALLMLVSIFLIITVVETFPEDSEFQLVLVGLWSMVKMYS
eukprot:g71719.t1